MAYKVLLDGDELDEFNEVTFGSLADAEHQARCMTEVDGIEPQRITIEVV